jgi:hypothetical protein
MAVVNISNTGSATRMLVKLFQNAEEYEDK